MARLATILAGGFLTLDGVLLLLAWHTTGRQLHLWLGAGFLAAALGVFLLWRRHLRITAQLARARQEAKAAAEALREVLPRD
ncbi:MAG TPA: hypothetical protein VG940_13990 [Gemmatimonadales bacterium]|jgi:hypothetical protein|nr:hypothetical protein [Gemmatimonadales bacterium]